MPNFDHSWTRLLISEEAVGKQNDVKLFCDNLLSRWEDEIKINRQGLEPLINLEAEEIGDSIEQRRNVLET